MILLLVERSTLFLKKSKIYKKKLIILLKMVPQMMEKETMPSSVGEQQGAEMSQPKKKVKWWLWLAIIAAVILVGVGIYLWVL